MKNVGKPFSDSREKSVHIIPSGSSESEAIDLGDATIVCVVMPNAWTTAALTIEVSADNYTFTGLAYNDLGSQCNQIAIPVAGSAYQLDMQGMLPYRYVRLRSGTTASPVNQGADRSITVITRPLA